ncbi:MAG: hypothetical protein M3297_08925 [Thermoproteota archaeon]|nr:hypothetical protein [Thermoproteota archaeon]
MFTIQVADAQLPSLSVSTEGVLFNTREFGLRADPSGVFLDPRVADTQIPFLDVGTGGVEVESEEFDLDAGPRAENGVDLTTREFRLSADPGGVFLDPRE